MELIYRTATGSQPEKPEEIDTSSESVVYIRKNIKQVTETDPATNTETKKWQYDEAVLTKDEYLKKLADDNAAQIAYVAMMSGVELEG